MIDERYEDRRGIRMDASDRQICGQHRRLSIIYSTRCRLSTKKEFERRTKSICVRQASLVALYTLNEDAPSPRSFRDPVPKMG